MSCALVDQGEEKVTDPVAVWSWPTPAVNICTKVGSVRWKGEPGDAKLSGLHCISLGG